MGIVSFIVDAANNGLNDVAQSQFAAVAAGMSHWEYAKSKRQSSWCGTRLA